MAERGLDLVPGPRGLEQLKYLRGFFGQPYEALIGLNRRYGSICRIGLAGQEYVVVFGAAGNEFLLNDSPISPRWSSREVLSLLIPVVGSTAMVVSDGADHRRRRSLVRPAFAHRRIEACLPTMLEEVNSMLDTWTLGQQLDAFQEVRSCIRRIAIRCLFGVRLQHHSDFVGDRLEIALRYINQSPFLRLDMDLPGFPYRRAVRARAEVEDIVRAEIEARAGEPDHGDVLAALIASKDLEGAGLSDLEVRDQVISLIASGYDSSSSAAGWAVYALLKHPGVLEKLRAELDAVFGDGPIEAARLRELSYLGWVVQEVLRLYTPGVVTGRTLGRDSTFDGVHLPAGTKVLYSQYVTHRLAELWPDPLRFDPARWDTAAPDYSAPSPYSYVPFGGGPRMCIGFAFAKLELKVLLAVVARRVDLKLLTDEVRPRGVATMWPRGGVPVVVSSLSGVSA